jgi:hypothetical protein
VILYHCPFSFFSNLLILTRFRYNGQFREMARRLMVRELLNEYYHTAVFEIKNADSGLSAFAFD